MRLSADFLSGARGLMPAAPGIFTFGVIAGVATVAAGFTPVQTVAFSIVAFAGAAQLAAVQMLLAGSPVPVIALAALVINLRFVLYSLAVGPHLRERRRIERWLIGYLLSDNAYAHTAARFNERPGDPANFDILLGNCAACWIAWQAGTVLGVVAGAAIPHAWSLEFVVTLTFFGLGVMQIQSRATAAAYVAGGAVALASYSLPYRLGLIAGALAGIAVGLAIEALERPRDGRAES